MKNMYKSGRAGEGAIPSFPCCCFLGTGAFALALPIQFLLER